MLQMARLLTMLSTTALLVTIVLLERNSTKNSRARLVLTGTQQTESERKIVKNVKLAMRAIKGDW